MAKVDLRLDHFFDNQFIDSDKCDRNRLMYLCHVPAYDRLYKYLDDQMVAIYGKLTPLNLPIEVVKRLNWFHNHSYEYQYLYYHKKVDDGTAIVLLGAYLSDRRAAMHYKLAWK